MNVMDVAAWLDELGLTEYVPAFRDNDIDTATLPCLTEQDLVDLGVKSVGHRRKLQLAISRLLDDPEPEDAFAAQAPADNKVQPRAENRQISMLYCDMVGSTALSERLDPEDYRELVRVFHQTGAQTIAEYGGFEANFIGDCVLAYFGWPQAHEDDAERAVRAGLALVHRIGATGKDLKARIGIATGPVLVGGLHEGPDQQQFAVGPTADLAERVQALANPGQVVIDEQTRRVVGESFVLQAMGSHSLEGNGQTVGVYAVSGERPAQSRFDARRGQNVAPMVGRDSELAVLLGRWSQARAGEGQVLLVVGDAGIGKSRLTRALLDACAGQAHWTLRLQCSPYHSSSALWPVIQHLNRAAGLDAQDSGEQVLDKLEATAGSTEAAALYATLLGLNGAQRYGPIEMTPQMLRERTLELLVEQLYELAESRPVLLVVEDAHCIDPTTLELIERDLERIDRARIFILITSRPDNQPNFAAHPGVTQLSLNRLSRVSVEAIVARLGGGLQAQTRATIVAQTDGVPLFVEELTKAVLETGEAAIPASLHGSLMARLDNLPEVKEVAQIAACIGREFDQALVQAVADAPASVPAALDKLAQAELVFRRGDPANPRCTFKHALVQEAAYQSLLRGKRQLLHGRILDALRAGARTALPEVLAHHASRAGRINEAIDHWQRAGNDALAKSAYVEAASYLGNAIELVRTCDDGRDRGAQELELQVRLGQAHAFSRGQGTDAAKDAFERAMELLNAYPTKDFITPAQYGLWAAYTVRAEHRQALTMSRGLVVASSGVAAVDAVFAQRALGMSLLLTGDLLAAREHLEKSLALYEGMQSPELSRQYSLNPTLTTYGYLVWALCMLGLADTALAFQERAREIATAAGEISTKVLWHYLFGRAQMLLRQPATVEQHARSMHELMSRYRMNMAPGGAKVLQAFADAANGRFAEAVQGCNAGFLEMDAHQTRLMRPFFTLSLAESLAASDRLEEACGAIEKAIVLCSETGEVFCEAELWRVRGDLQLRDKARGAVDAVASFEHALGLARSQRARLWELRAATSLARLWADQGERGRALELLAPVYDSFTEGTGTADLQEASALLDALRVPTTCVHRGISRS